MVDGIDCPFCPPRPDDSPFWIKIATLGTSTLYLDRNQTYWGHCLLVFDARHVIGMESLAPGEFTGFMADLHASARAIAAACQPDLMNYASLGNVIPHLHWHLVPRYKDDPRWGGRSIPRLGRRCCIHPDRKRSITRSSTRYVGTC